MAIPRCADGTSLTNCPSIISSPPVIFSSPAIIRSKVDLPQPDGPTNTINSPVLISKLMSFRTSTLPPYVLATFVSLSSAMVVILPIHPVIQIAALARKTCHGVSVRVFFTGASAPPTSAPIDAQVPSGRVTSAVPSDKLKAQKMRVPSWLRVK